MADMSPRSQAEEKADAVDLSTPQSPEKDLAPKTEDFERLFELKPEMQNMETDGQDGHDIENPAPTTAADNTRRFFPRGSALVIRRTRVRRRSPQEDDESFTFMLLYLFFLAVLGFWLLRTSAQLRWRKKVLYQCAAQLQQEQRAHAKIIENAKKQQTVAEASKVMTAGDVPPKQAKQQHKALAKLGELIGPIEDAFLWAAETNKHINSSMSRSECIPKYEFKPSDEVSLDKAAKLNNAMKLFREEAPSLVEQLTNEKATLSKQDKEDMETLISSSLKMKAFSYDFENKVALDRLVSGSEGPQ
jgi:hypothetical protein